MKLYQNNRGKRSGIMLVMFVVLLPVLIGFVGLVIDGGLLMATFRQTQNAADAAALAAAKDMLREFQYPGSTGGFDQWVATAKDYAQRNGVPVDGVVVHIGPESGPYAGNDHFVEVIISNPWQTFFIQVLGIGPQQRVVARAVAGFEIANFDVLVILDPSPGGGGAALQPGLDVTGGGTLQVQGSISVNAEGDPAARAMGGGSISATSVSVVGAGVAGFSTDLVNQLPAPDPFLYSLHPPTMADGVQNQFPDKNVQNSGTAPNVVTVGPSETATLYPGIYNSITIQGTATLMPGIYVLWGGGLKINNAVVVGNGVMFYNTGRDYNWQTGAPDNGDGSIPPPAHPPTDFGDITINSQSLQLTPYQNTDSVFHNMLIYQRPWNTQPISISSQGTGNVILGGMYAKWAQLTLTGGSSVSAALTVKSQIVVGSVNVTGNASLIPGLTVDTPVAYQVFLVE